MNFAAVFSALRRERGISQRQAASDLDISQALLSHYEKGIREPRLDFIEKACRYYGVSADYILGMEVGDAAGPDGPLNELNELLTPLMTMMRERGAEQFAADCIKMEIALLSARAAGMEDEAHILRLRAAQLMAESDCAAALSSCPDGELDVKLEENSDRLRLLATAILDKR